MLQLCEDFQYQYDLLAPIHLSICSLACLVDQKCTCKVSNSLALSKFLLCSWRAGARAPAARQLPVHAALFSTDVLA